MRVWNAYIRFSFQDFIMKNVNHDNKNCNCNCYSFDQGKSQLVNVYSRKYTLLHCNKIHVLFSNVIFIAILAIFNSHKNVILTVKTVF